MKEPLWKEIRETYKRYRASKRNMFAINKQHNSTYFHLESAFNRYMDTQARVTNNLDDDRFEEVHKAYNDFRQAKLNHDATRHAFSEALKQFKKCELRYARMIFKGFREIGIKMTNIAKIFGFTTSTMSRWINFNEKELSEYYKDEFGEDL